MTDIRKESKQQIAAWLEKSGEKIFRAKQIEAWIWKKGVNDFSKMTNLSEHLRQLLQNKYSFYPVSILEIKESVDGSRKVLFRTHDQHDVEGVLIPDRTRVTACISSQIGCVYNCSFCATGQMKFIRNLEYPEIFDQFFMLNELSMQIYGRKLSNLVYMGMGEPLQNYDDFIKSVEIITAPTKIGWSPSRITVSTVGVANNIRKLAFDQSKINLAVSLHSAIEQKRVNLMPHTKTYDLIKLSEDLVFYHQQAGQRITIEYILLDGVNDAHEDAKALALWCKSFPVKINLIEYNKVPQLLFSKSDDEKIRSFKMFLEKNNMIVNIRRSKGKDIHAACGQLACLSKKNNS